MNLYISDLHFGHRNVIGFDHRPFLDWEAMDACMIRLWNSRVNNDDHVYVLGDFAYRSDRDECWYLRQLKGHKHLIVGNHDGKLLENEKALTYFESVDKLLGITDMLKGEKVTVVLCHYPMAEWYKSRHGSWHIHGHIHRATDQTAKYMASIEHTLNAGAVINNYTPASMNELIRNNEEFRKRYLADNQG